MQISMYESAKYDEAVDKNSLVRPMTNLLFHQLFIQCHGFDMREEPLPRLQS